MSQPLRTPLLGRDDALDTIRSTLAGGPGAHLVIVGRAGLGRTRLAREAAVLAEAADRPVHWVTATRPAALVPLGAFAHLLPSLEAGQEPLVLLQRATATLAGDHSPAPVLCVDDVHLLDPLSVALLQQLAAAGSVTLVLTVRADGGYADPTAPLWKDGLATRVDLEPLGRSEADALVERLLRGEVDSRTLEGLWQLGRGNPLFLCELVEDGRRRSRLCRRDDVWHWEGSLEPSRRLTEIVLGQLGDLDVSEARALELVASVTPLGIAVDPLSQRSGPEAVARLERRGVLVDDVAGPPGHLRTAQPLYTAVLRSRMSEATVRRERTELLAAGGAVTADDTLLRCVASLDSDRAEQDPAALTVAAERALGRHDLRLAEELSRAAVAVSGGGAAGAVLAEALWWQGDPDGAEAVAAEAMSAPAGAVRAAALRALVLQCGLGRPDAAREVLRRAGAGPVGPGDASLLGSARAALCLLGGEVRRAVGTAASVLRTAPADSDARPLAAAVAAVGLAVRGSTRAALVLVRSSRDALEAATSPLAPSVTTVLTTHAEVVALTLAGRIEDLERRAEVLLRLDLAGSAWSGDAVAALHRGWAELAAGRPRPALRWLREAQAGLTRADPLGLRQLGASLVVLVATLFGRAEITREQRFDDEAGAGPATGATLFRPYAVLARACLAAVDGRANEALTTVLEAARIAEGQGQPGLQAQSLHRAVELGGAAEVAPALRELSARLDAPLVDELARHADAAAARKPELLREVADRFERAGAVLLAARATEDAAAEYARSRDEGAARRCGREAIGLFRLCGFVLPHHLGDHGAVPTLTGREREMAQLACGGLSNQGIADRLVVSVRTVETHLSNIYTKLGITGRADLAGALAETGVVPPPRRPVPVGRASSR